jgi:hypothetical protein
MSELMSTEKITNLMNQARVYPAGHREFRATLARYTEEGVKMLTDCRFSRVLAGRHRVLVLAVFFVVTVFVVSCAQGQTGEPEPLEETVAASRASAQSTGPRQVHHRRSTVAPVPKTLEATAAEKGCSSTDRDRIYRFIAGHDKCPVGLTPSEIDAELNDPWAKTVLRRGSFPASVKASVSAINVANPAFLQNSYMVGEGSQIPVTVVSREGTRDLRYLITWNLSGDAVDILLSAAPGGDSGFLQVISWDPKKKRFNFYDHADPTWIWTGDSSWARKQHTIGKGCFDCHHNGVTIMKELNKPWNNWKSALALIQAAVVPEAVAQENLFRNLKNAPQLESAIQGTVQRYYKAWLPGLLTHGGTQVSNVPEILRHLIVNTTVQLDSTQINSDPTETNPLDAPVTGLPSNFFLWDTVLSSVLQLQYKIPRTRFKRAAYETYLRDKAFKLANDGPPGYHQAGSTNFAFFVPVPPQEDLFMVQLMLQKKVVSKKFVTAVLMVDFQNPVFSATRQSLQKYADKIASGKLDGNDIPDRFAAEVAAAAAGQPACDPSRLDSCGAEQQFLHFWNLTGDQWKTEAETRLTAYMSGIAAQFSGGGALDAYMSLSVSRRHQFATTPVISNLCEFALLLPRTNLPEQTLRMSTDGTVVAGMPNPNLAPARCLAPSQTGQ